MAFDLRCPQCGTRYTVGVELENVTFGGSGGMNVVAPCPRCGHVFDAAPGDGTYSVVGRRLIRIAETIAGSSRVELESLRAEIRRVADRQDTVAAVELAQGLGWQPPETAKSRLTVGNEALDFIIKMQIVLAMLLAGTAWTVDTVHGLLDQWVK